MRCSARCRNSGGTSKGLFAGAKKACSSHRHARKRPRPNSIGGRRGNTLKWGKGGRTRKDTAGEEVGDDEIGGK